METLYYRPKCPFCIKVLDLISALNITVKMKNIEENKDFYNELLLGTDRVTVPCLKTEDGSFLFDSNKIIHHINRNHVLANHPMNMQEALLTEYTDILDSISKETGLDSILIMVSMEDKMHVLVTNKNNHYHMGDAGEKSHISKHKKPLYCERVVKTGKPLHVADASADPEWSENEDLVIFGLGVYLGFPVKKDDSVVGTVCALHDKPFDFKSGNPSVYDRLETVRDTLEVMI